MEAIVKILPLPGELFQPDDVKVPRGVVLEHLAQLDGDSDVAEARQQGP